MTLKCLLLIFTIVFHCCSCNTPRYIYSPSAPNNPYFKEKGDSKLSTYYTSGVRLRNRIGRENYGFDLQTAYAISNKWALTAGFFNRKEKDIYPSRNDNYFNSYFDSSAVKYNRRITDFGGGYFIPLDRSRSVYFAMYSGLGLGKFSFTDNGIDKARVNYSRFHHSAITKWFVQPSLNLFDGNYLRVSFIAKFSFVHYGNIATSYTNDELQFYWLDKIKNKTIGYIEPSLNMQFGIPPAEWVKIDGGFTFSSDPFYKNPQLQARVFNASIGLSFDFTKLKKKSK
jgi:hypothetical protein